jgi:hypothetical protein
MGNNDKNEVEMDELLRKVLQDDIPPETERKMRRQFVQFWEMAGETDGKRFAWPRWIFQPEVLAFSSPIMILVGGFSLLSRRPSALADTLSFVKTTVSISDRLLGTTSRFPFLPTTVPL